MEKRAQRCGLHATRTSGKSMWTVSKVCSELYKICKGDNPPLDTPLLEKISKVGAYFRALSTLVACAGNPEYSSWFESCRFERASPPVDDFEMV